MGPPGEGAAAEVAREKKWAAGKEDRGKDAAVGRVCAAWREDEEGRPRHWLDSYDYSCAGGSLDASLDSLWRPFPSSPRRPAHCDFHWR